MIYLVVQGQRQRREHLMTLLWPDLPQASAQQNLRQNLYLMAPDDDAVPARSGEGMVPLILGDREYPQLNPEAAVQVDANRLDTILDRLIPSTGELEEAVALYRGDFLADFYLPQSSELKSGRLRVESDTARVPWMR